MHFFIYFFANRNRKKRLQETYYNELGTRMFKSDDTPEDLNLDGVCYELIRAIRAHRSQNTINKRLKFKFNQVSRWETGRKRILWNEFVDLCKACHIDAGKAMNRATGFPGRAKDTGGIFRHLLAETEVKAFAARLGVSRPTLSRWLLGSVNPPLCQVLKALQVSSKSLFLFLEVIVDLNELPSLQAQYKSYLSTCDLERRIPEVGAILRCFDLATYQENISHAEGFIAKTLGISVAKEQEWILILESAGLIFRLPNGSYRPTTLHTDTRGDFEASRRLRIYWLNNAREALSSLSEPPPPDEAFGYLIYCVSQEDKKQIITKYFELFNFIRDIASRKDTRATEINILNIQIFKLEKLLE